MRDTPRTEMVKQGIDARGKLRGFNMPEDLADALECSTKLELELTACREEQHAVWQYLEVASPWTKSNDLPWADEILCSVGLLEQRASQAESKLSAAYAAVRDADYLNARLMFDSTLAEWRKKHAATIAAAGDGKP